MWTLKTKQFCGTKGEDKGNQWGGIQVVRSKEFLWPIIFQGCILRVCISMGGGGANEQRGAIFPLGTPVDQVLGRHCDSIGFATGNLHGLDQWATFELSW